MLSRYNPIDIEHILRTSSPPPPFPPGSDRAAWERIRAEIGEQACAWIIGEAETAAREPVPSLSATLYLEFLREGRREGYEAPAQQRRRMLASLALAECLEFQGRFLDPLLDVAWATCEESSWSWPAHQRELTDLAAPVIDLNVAMTALHLAELDLLLGAQLPPALGKRIRDEVDHRCLTPYLTRHDHWWLYNTHSRRLNNWTAVCNGGVVGAAIYLEQDPARLAEILARAARSLDDYLDTFDPDGGSSEGPGYWSYGFGYYTILAHLVEHRTEGRMSLLDGEHLRNIAAFPLSTQLTPRQYVNFSDCDRNISFVAPHLVYLSHRLEIPALTQLAREQPEVPTTAAAAPANSSGARPRGGRQGELTWALRGLVWRVEDEPSGAFTPARHDWFSGMMWMIARQNPEDPGALVVAVKGGHNGEMHNQNDVGALIVCTEGEAVIADLGRGRYTKAYFGPQRYDHFVNSSLGHSVPVVNGHAQAAGKQHGAELLEHVAGDDADVLYIDLAGAYPAKAGLASLQRRVVLRRESPRGGVELSDEVEFAGDPGMLESVLLTFGEAHQEQDSVLLKGERGALRVRYDPSVVTPRIETIPDVDLAEGRTTVQRVVFALTQPTHQARVDLQIAPA